MGRRPDRARGAAAAGWLAAAALAAWLPGGANGANGASGASGASAAAASGAAPATAAGRSGPSACWLRHWPQAARCGVLQRPLDPARPQGPQIGLHYAVVPAVARHKAADAVFFFAGGPGQSAIDLAGPLASAFGRLHQRRDLVFVDQRGTGRSAPLKCPDDAERAMLLPLAGRSDPDAQVQRLKDCRQALQALPHGDLRFYTTELAMADVDAVRQALGLERINLIGASYGTRAVLSYQRQFPQVVRRAVLDGVAPPDMRLPEATGPDNQAAFDALLQACAAQPACASRHPQLRLQWTALLAGLPRSVTLPHPVSGRSEVVVLQRDAVLGLVRAALYSPVLAAALPAALAEAAADRWAPLATLSAGLGGGAAGIASGMHFSVVCAEDLGPGAPVPATASVSASPGATAPAVSADAAFGAGLLPLYQRVCADWPRGAVSPGFYTLPPARTPTWLLSGGLDPVTPPRHGQRVARALGDQARHVVVPHAGHGVMALPCLQDAVSRFIDTDDETTALATPADCAAAVPRPPAFVPPGWSAPGASAASGARP